MTGLSTPAAETVVIQYLTSVLGGVRVSSDLPPDFGADGDPGTYVWINAFPGVPAAEPWQGSTLLWEVVFDVDVFAQSRVDCEDLGRLVSDQLPGITSYRSTYGQITKCGAPTLGPRSDWNTTTRRYGATVETRVRRAQAAG